MQSLSCYCCLSFSGHLPGLSDHLEFCTFLSVAFYFIIYHLQIHKVYFLSCSEYNAGILNWKRMCSSCFRIWGSRFLNCWVQFLWIMVFTLWLLLHLYGMKEDKIKIRLEQRYVYIAIVTLNCSNSFKWFGSIKDRILAFQWITHYEMENIHVVFFT